MSALCRSRVGLRYALLLVVGLGVTTTSEAQTITRGPYLQMGSHDRIVVRWRTDVPTDSQVSYGLCQGQASCMTWVAVNPVVTTEHEVLLQGLSPKTRYYYAVGSTTEQLAGNNANHFFLTSPRVGEAKATRIWVLGDSGSANANARAVRDAYYKATGSLHTDLWLMLGDNAYRQRDRFGVPGGRVQHVSGDVAQVGAVADAGQSRRRVSEFRNADGALLRELHVAKESRGRRPRVWH